MRKNYDNKNKENQQHQSHNEGADKYRMSYGDVTHLVVPGDSDEAQSENQTWGLKGNAQKLARGLECP